MTLGIVMRRYVSEPLYMGDENGSYMMGLERIVLLMPMMIMVMMMVVVVRSMMVNHHR